MSTESVPSVVVVEDDPAVQNALRLLLQSVGLATTEYANALDFLGKQDLSQAGCLILDVRLPGMSGLDLLDRLRAKGEDVPVIVMSGHADVPMAVRAIKAGAMDFLEKPVNPQRLLDLVHRGLEQSGRRQPMRAQRADFQARLDLLTAREKETLDMMLTGLSNKEIAAELDISPKTLDIHRGKVFEKMQTRTLGALFAEMWRYAPPDPAKQAKLARRPRKTVADAPKTPEDAPKTPEDAPKTPTPEESTPHKRKRGRPRKTS